MVAFTFPKCKDSQRIHSFTFISFTFHALKLFPNWKNSIFSLKCWVRSFMVTLLSRILSVLLTNIKTSNLLPLSNSCRHVLVHQSGKTGQNLCPYSHYYYSMQMVALYGTHATHSSYNNISIFNSYGTMETHIHARKHTHAHTKIERRMKSGESQLTLNWVGSLLFCTNLNFTCKRLHIDVNAITPAILTLDQFPWGKFELTEL